MPTDKVDAPLSLVMLPGFDGSGRLFDLFKKELTLLQPNLSIKTVSYPATGTHSYSELFEFVQSQLPHGDYFLLELFVKSQIFCLNCYERLYSLWLNLKYLK